MNKQPTHTQITVAIFGALALMSGSVATAAPLTVTNFVPGAAATAADANAKFAEVETAVNDNDARVTTNIGNIVTNTGNIGSNTTAIGVNTGNVGTNTAATGVNAGNIGTNTTNIGTNMTDIGTNTVNVGINTTDIGTNATAIGDHETRITTLEGAGAGGESSADNPPISVNCLTESLQAAIEASPLHGRTEITISGACTDDIFIRRSGITIQGATGPGTDSITGNLSGFSSDPTASFNLSGATTFVQKTLSAAVEMSSRARVVLKNMTINAGTNATAVLAARNTSVKLVSVTLNGGVNGFGLHLSNSDAIVKNVNATGNGTGAASLFAGSGAFADENSVLEIRDGNTFTAGDGTDAGGLSVFSNTSVHLIGINNVFNAGAGGVPTGLVLTMNSTLVQPIPGSGNQINGAVEVSDGSRVFLQSMAITGDFLDVYNAAVYLEPASANSITVTIASNVGLESGAILGLGSEGNGLAVGINGTVTVVQLFDHSILSMRAGSQVNMDMELHRGSSVVGFGNSKINGNLEVHGFSEYVQSDQVGSSVSGTVTCFKGEAFDFTAAAPGAPAALGSCL